MKGFVKVICVILSVCLLSSCERRKVPEYEPETSPVTSTTKNNNIETSVSPEPMADSKNATKLQRNLTVMVLQKMVLQMKYQ